MIQSNEKTTKGHYEALAEVLGENYIGERIESPFDFISLANRGIKAKVLLNFREHFDIPRDMAADLLNVSEPTVYRWIKNDATLEKTHSIQLFELTDLFLFGIEVLESRESFFKWIQLPNVALGGLKPSELLNLPEGISKVRDLLGRIEYGVYS